MNRETPIAGIILAAGMSLRFGHPKQLLKFRGRTLIEIVVDAALGSKLGHVVLVLGHESAAIIQALAHRTTNSRLDILENDAFRQGMSTSIRLGLRALYQEFPSVMLILADHPLMRSESIDELQNRYRASHQGICIPVHHGRRGNPTIFGRRFYDQLLKIKGDTGGREIIRNHPQDVCYLETDDPAFFWDIDTPEDLKKFKAMSSKDILGTPINK